jgi:GNAT superfamily N-acetyltransferase
MAGLSVGPAVRAALTTVIEIRDEHPEDVAAIRDVNRQAFGQDVEGAIVDALRTDGAALLSLVAAQHGEIVGHIMYSPVRVGDVTGAALAPMAVLPGHQRHGIGSELVRTSLFAEFNANGLEKDAADAFSVEQRGDVAWKVFYVVAPDGLCYWFGERQP